ncbi:hypothetical protein H8958_022080 [Nasalis larvatus]
MRRRRAGPGLGSPPLNSSNILWVVQLGRFRFLTFRLFPEKKLLAGHSVVLAPLGRGFSKLKYPLMSQILFGKKGMFFRQLPKSSSLDGFIARNWANQKSALGSALDPLADKILISILYVSLTYADLIPVPLTYMIISRDVMLIAAVFYVRYRTLPAPRTLAKYFNPCYATARLKPTFISKVNTAVQLILVAASLAAPVFNYADSIYLQILWCFTAFTTAASAYSYYHYGRKTVQVIKD